MHISTVALVSLRLLCVSCADKRLITNAIVRSLALVWSYMCTRVRDCLELRFESLLCVFVRILAFSLLRTAGWVVTIQYPSHKIS